MAPKSKMTAAKSKAAKEQKEEASKRKADPSSSSGGASKLPKAIENGPGQPEGEEPSDKQTLGKQELHKMRSAMLNSLRYKAKSSEEASSALAVYASMTAELKVAFVARWDAEGRGKRGASLSWTSAMDKQYAESDTRKVETTSGFLPLGKILQDRLGLSFTVFEIDMEVAGSNPPKTKRCIDWNAVVCTVRDAVISNHREHGVDSSDYPEKTHENPLLSEWYFVHHSGLMTNNSATQCTRTTSSLDKIKAPPPAHALGNLNKGFGNSPSKIKDEETAASYEPLLIQIAKCKTGLQQCRRSLGEGSSLLARLTIRARADTAALGPKVQEFKVAQDSMGDWLSTYELQLAEWEQLRPQDPEDTVAEAVRASESIISVASDTLGAFRLKLREMSRWVS